MNKKQTVITEVTAEALCKDTDCALCALLAQGHGMKRRASPQAKRQAQTMRKSIEIIAGAS
jgi:hypothetical protein